MAYSDRDWWDTISGVCITALICAAAVAVVWVITWGLVQTANNKRDLMRECMQGQPPHALSDCRNSIYGAGR